MKQRGEIGQARVTKPQSTTTLAKRAIDEDRIGHVNLKEVIVNRGEDDDNMVK